MSLATEKIFVKGIDFELIDCCECQVPFAVTVSMKRRLRETGKTFYCPSCGTRQSYTAQPAEQKLREDLAAEKKHRAQLETRLDHERAPYRDKSFEVDVLNRQVSARKGQITKLKNRIGNGVCPCCSRHFTNVERHMKSQHPDFQEKEE